MLGLWFNFSRLATQQKILQHNFRAVVSSLRLPGHLQPTTYDWSIGLGLLFSSLLPPSAAPHAIRTPHNKPGTYPTLEYEVKSEGHGYRVRAYVVVLARHHEADVAQVV